MGRRLLTSTLLLTAGFAWAVNVNASSPHVSAIITSPQARLNYLAHARIWKNPGVLSPQDMLDGPAGVLPYTYEQATSGTIECTFAKPGTELGGLTEKFLCATRDGRTLRLKYWAPTDKHANREVFSGAAGTRLLWALGFDALPTLPTNVRCLDCPENPMTGKGERSVREYLGELQAYPPAGPWILSREDHDQGWSWRELDEATASLPPGPERVQQRTHFDALTLLGVFMQHGDRKPEQQALYCAGSVDLERGETQSLAGSGLASTLFERPDASACGQSAAMIVDVGATFGGGGRTSDPATAKMNLDHWRSRKVFKDSGDGRACRGRLVVSLKAGHDGEKNPVVSEEGRQFLIEQLRRLTPDHIRALFTAARVDKLGDGSRRATPADTIVDEWVTAFEDKMQEIAAQRCQPAS